MKNQTNDGVSCDYCADDAKNDFIYYSFDFYEVQTTDKTSRLSSTASYTADLCERCMELFRIRLRAVAETVVESLTRCDVTGAACSGQYYKCRISKVVVNLSGQQYVCSACNKPTDPQSEPCTCGCDKLIRNASVGVDKEYLELNFSSEIFSKFVDHIKHTSELGDVEWAKQ